MRLPGALRFLALPLACVGIGCTLLVSTSGLGGPDAPSDAALGDAEGPSEGSVPDALPSEDAASSGDAGPAIDGGVKWDGNGHTYLVVLRPGGVTWQAAKVEAEALGGHLVTLTSAAENVFVYGLLGARSARAWIGAEQPAGSAEPAGGWRWITGEPWEFTAWGSIQPNNLGDEDVMFFDADGQATWSDNESGDLTTTSYVVELE